MRGAAALVRAQWLTHTSYRVGVILSFVALAATIVPVYFIADALQPVVGTSIQGEGEQYFGFLVIGLASLYLVGAALTSLPEAVGGGIHSGTLEALFCTPASVPTILCGLVGFPLMWAGIRAAILVVMLAALGGSVVWTGLPLALVATVLTVLAYGGVGLMAAALVLAFRTAGPLLQGVLAASSLLGGVYYSTTVIPEPFDLLALFVPLTYGLRLVRRTLLEGAPVGSLVADGLALGALTAGLLALGALVFWMALSHSRRSGSLGQY